MQSRVDLSQHAETYYFRERDPAVSLAAHADYAVLLADAGRHSGRPDVRLYAAVLSAAVDSLSQLLAASFVGPGGDADTALARYAAEHGAGPA